MMAEPAHLQPRESTVVEVPRVARGVPSRRRYRRRAPGAAPCSANGRKRRLSQE